MTLRERVGNALLNRQPEVKIISPPKEKLSTSGLGAGFLELFRPGLQGEKTASEQLIKAFYGWVYANVSAIAEEVSKLQPELYRVSFKAGDIVHDRILQHPLLDLLDKFNSINTASEAFYLTSANIELAGDSFLLKDRPNQPQELYILNPTCITVNPKADGFGVDSYDYKHTVDGKTKTVNYQPELIIHIKTPNPENPLRGKSTVAAAATSIDTSNLAQEFLKTFFKNGAIVSFALTSDQRITNDEIRRVQQQLKREYGGVMNAFKTLILGGGFDVKQVQHSNKDMEVLQLEEAMRDKIMAMFKNTKTSLGIVEDVNRANAEASMASWKANVIKPKITRIVDALNEYLVPEYGNNLLLGFKDPVPEDREGKISEANTLVNKVISVNEARELLGYQTLGPEFDHLISEQEKQAQQQAMMDSRASQLPKSLGNVSYERHMRRQGVYSRFETYKGLYEAARGVAARLMTPKASKSLPVGTKPRKYTSYDDTTALDYWQKQIAQTEIVEQLLKNKIDQYLKGIEDKAINALAENANKKGGLKVTTTKADLVNEDAEVQGAIDLFTPLLDEIAKLSGITAYELMNVSRVYSPSRQMQKTIHDYTKLMANSVVGTDSAKLEAILSQGLQEGRSIADIEVQIRDVFGQFRKFQSERIARTEVLRASNAGSLDAYKESGVVEAVQWLTAPDCNDECLDYEGRTEAVGGTFFDADYGSGEQPPLHVNCRCTLIPVLA